jgi:catechol 2,3-dioxygenase-like lactoylglutathione lyase family enzyme
VVGDARLLRTALIVRDVERSLRFYALFGYVPESDMAGPRDPAQDRVSAQRPPPRSFAS